MKHTLLISGIGFVFLFMIWVLWPSIGSCPNNPNVTRLFKGTETIYIDDQVTFEYPDTICSYQKSHIANHVFLDVRIHPWVLYSPMGSGSFLEVTSFQLKIYRYWIRAKLGLSIPYAEDLILDHMITVSQFEGKEFEGRENRPPSKLAELVFRVIPSEIRTTKNGYMVAEAHDPVQDAERYYRAVVFSDPHNLLFSFSGPNRMKDTITVMMESIQFGEPN